MHRLESEWAGESLSHGTLRPEDLIPAFEGFIKQSEADLSELARPEAVAKLLSGDPLTDDEQEAVSSYLNEDLFDALNEIAPEGTTFGSHPGDGTDFGFWLNDDE